VKTFLLLFGAGLGLISAGFWFWSTFAAVTRDQELKRRERQAAKTGATPNLAGFTVDGLDLLASIRKGSQINAAAALLAGLSVLVQTASNFVD
jgi:hypothetical protein